MQIFVIDEIMCLHYLQKKLGIYDFLVKIMENKR